MPLHAGHRGALSRADLGAAAGPDRHSLESARAVPYADLNSGSEAEPSSAIRARVEAARERQRERFTMEPGVPANAHMSSRVVRRHCRQSDEVGDILKNVREAIQYRSLDRRLSG